MVMIWTASRSPSTRSSFPSSGAGITTLATSAVRRRATSPMGRDEAAASAATTSMRCEHVGEAAQAVAAGTARVAHTRVSSRIPASSRPRSVGLGEAVPLEQAVQQALGAPGHRRREIGEPQAEEGRQPGAQPLARIVRVGDGAQQIAQVAGLLGFVEALLVVEDMGDTAGSQGGGDRLGLAAGPGEDERFTGGWRVRRGPLRGDLVGHGRHERARARGASAACFSSSATTRSRRPASPPRRRELGATAEGRFVHQVRR